MANLIVQKSLSVDKKNEKDDSRVNNINVKIMCSIF